MPYYTYIYIYIYIYIFACVARLLVSRARYKSRGITCTHVARGAIETNIRNVEIRGNVWAGGLAS